MRNDLIDILQGFIQDIEDASPNTKNKLKEIYPINFKLSLSGPVSYTHLTLPTTD